jgi:ATP-dependent RNA helicase DDX55/SPB4
MSRHCGCFVIFISCLLHTSTARKMNCRAISKASLIILDFLMFQLYICYMICRDKTREKQRQKALKKKETEAEKSHDAKPEKTKKDRDGNDANAPTRKKTGRQRRAIQTKEDYEELEQEYRLLKKLKKGVIDEEEYERLMGFGVEMEEDEGRSDDGNISAKIVKGKKNKRVTKKSKQRGGSWKSHSKSVMTKK